MTSWESMILSFRQLGRALSEDAILQDYLATIYRLEEAYGIARTTKIAEELDVTPATAAKMLSKFEKMGLVERDKYRGARLTEEGRKIAIKAVWKHRVCEYFLKTFFKLPLTKLHIYAHIMEHLPEEVVEQMYELVGRPSCCPHGNPLPGVSITDNTRPLSEEPAGKWVKVARIVGEFRNMLDFLERVGIDIGTRLQIIKVTQRDVIVMLDSGNIVTIPSEYAFLMRVVDA